ncbi:hypothetical protein [Celeribacter sp. PS-C1]|uniref:hypothetical protein n=1 Tax=Celeribacter sp. PS-C1 TaxID=2820813 RepID=UPI001CA51282|nr:hypothetical protein [Celeribacter sp. PS-C1]MBW6419350.1 hypothetical protein [Celeribacter sp. PS-C1]
MTGVYRTLSRDKKIDELERALDYIGTMITERSDGETYTGLYETLEAELEGLRAQDNVKERVRQRLAARTMPLAA